MAILGKNIYISVVSGNSSTIIAGTKANEIQVGAETIEISGPNTGAWRQYIVGRKEWSFTTNFLVLANSNVADLLKAGTEVNIQVVGRTGSNQTTTILSGSAIIKTARQTFTLGNIANGSFQFVGNGALTATAQS